MFPIAEVLSEGAVVTDFIFPHPIIVARSQGATISVRGTFVARFPEHKCNPKDDAALPFTCITTSETSELLSRPRMCLSWR